MPKISVIIPVYNVEKYLRECLDSVVNQTLKDIEIICVDDGSVDSSPAILAEYAAKDSRVKVITQVKSNAGAARNAGMAVATGEYLGFVDSDDWCELTMLDHAYWKAVSDGADLVVWRHDSFDIREDSKTTCSTLPEKFNADNALTDYNYAPWNRLVKADFIRSEGLRFQEIPRFNDVYFSCMTFLKASRVSLLDEVLYHYRLGMTTNLQANNAGTPDAIIEALKKTIADCLGIGLPSLKRQLATASLNQIFYTLQTIGDKAVYVAFWHRVRRFVLEDAFLSGIREGDVNNSNTAASLSILREVDSPEDFLIRQQKNNREAFSALWYDRQRLKLELKKCWKVRRKLWNDRNRLRDRCKMSFAVSPTVSVVVIPEEDSESLIADNRRIGKHIEGLSANIVETLPFEKSCAAKGDYVAVLWTNERYISRYSLENLVLMAAENHVATACGTVDGGFVGDAVYSRKALEENDWDFGRLRADCSVFRGVPTVRAARVDEKGIPNAEYEYHLLELSELSAVSERQHFEEMLKRLCFADRLDLAGVFLARLANSKLSAKVIGELLNSFGYPYLEAFLSESDRRRGPSILNRLRESLRYGISTHRFSFRKDAWSVAKAKARDEGDGSPLLSVVMPVYNVELYLVRAIESVRKQTYEDWELICVDDGSTDDSSSILDFYAAVDSRIRVFHRENHGVSDTRNFALSMVRGKYVTFIDGDDWYGPTMIEETVGAAEDNDVDVCFFDFVCRKYDTLERVHHFWTFSNLSGNWPIGTVWSADSLDKWWWYGSFCQTVWKTAFFREHSAAFPLIPLGEDTVLMATLFPFVRRGYVINKAFYNYQRGNPTSAVSRMVSGSDNGYLKKENALLDVYRNVYQKKCGESVCKKFIGRILSDICYDGKQDARVIEWLKTTGVRGLGLDNVDERYMINPAHLSEMHGLMASVAQVEVPPYAATPHSVLKIMRDIESRRKGSKKDLYLVSGQLSSADDEAIDGWSFFLYLKGHGIPAKYLVWKRHRRCAEFCKDSPEDVIVIDDVGNSSYELLTRHSDLFVRARAVAQEWLMPNPDIAEWLKSLKGLVYFFLQHGVMHFHPVRSIHYHWWRGFNLINFSSEYERDTVMRDISGADFGVRGVVCGLARWDSLVDLQDRNDRVLFVMLTFRPTYKNQPERFVKSQYCFGLSSLLSSENILRLKRSGVRVVLGVHHAMSHVSDWAAGIDSSVEIAKSDQISYWIRHASCLITDSSSVSFDFLYQGKPVVFWIPDRFDPILSAVDREKMRIAEFFQYRLLPPVLSPSEAVDQVLAYAKDGFKMGERATGCVNRFFMHRNDHCRRICQAIEDNWSEEC